MLWLLLSLASVLLEGRLCRGIHPPESTVPLISTSEAHGPLARLALHSSGGGFPYYTRRGVPPDPALVRLAAFPSAEVYPVGSAANVIQPILRAVNVTEPRHTTAELQVKRPEFGKQCHDIEERAEDRPIGTAAVDLDGQIPKNLAAPLVVSPEIRHAVSLYRPTYAFPVSSYPLVSYYYPFQVPLHAYPPAFVQPPQGVVQVPQQTPAYPQRPVFAPPPPQQSPIYPQQPVQAPKPPQQTPAYPFLPPAAQPPQPNPVLRPPGTSAGNEEFDYSDTVVIDNPEFERLANRRGQLEIPSGGFSRSFQPEEKVCDEEKEAKRILEEFQNRQLLRLFMKQNRSVLVGPSQIQTFRELEELGQQLNSGDGFDGAAEVADGKSSATEKAPSTENQGVTFFLRSSTNDSEIIIPKSKNTPAVGPIDFVRKGPVTGQSSRQRLYIELVTDNEEDTSGEEGVVRARLVSVTPVPDGDGVAAVKGRSSSRRVVVSRPLEKIDVPQVTRLVRPTLAAAVIYRR